MHCHVIGVSFGRKSCRRLEARGQRRSLSKKKIVRRLRSLVELQNEIAKFQKQYDAILSLQSDSMKMDAPPSASVSQKFRA